MKQKCARIGKLSVTALMGIISMWLIFSFYEVNTKNLRPSEAAVNEHNAFRIVTEVKK